MKKLFDLHIHSVYSDGRKTPAEICAEAKAAGLYGFALTDHDTVAGLDEAAAAAERAGLCFVPGIEVSGYDGCEIHILGLGIDYKDSGFLSALEEIRKIRDARNLQILKKLQSMGINITEEDLTRHGRGSAGRGQIARAMAAKGYAATARDAFHEFLAEGGPADCGNVSVPPCDAIELIHKGKGKAYLAHPGRLKLSDNDKFRLIDKLAGLGLDGIEVYYPKHGKELIKKLLKAARERNLLICGGTDHHGVAGDAPIGSERISKP